MARAKKSPSPQQIYSFLGSNSLTVSYNHHNAYQEKSFCFYLVNVRSLRMLRSPPNSREPRPGVTNMAGGAGKERG